MSAAEQFVLTISERGFGKRTSSYEYRTTGRGGKGIVAMDNRDKSGAIRPRIGRLVASPNEPVTPMRTGRVGVAAQAVSRSSTAARAPRRTNGAMRSNNAKGRSEMGELRP